MKGTILETIVGDKRLRVDAAKALTDRHELANRAAAARYERNSHRLRDALSDTSGINIIAEFKRASPSKGLINDASDPAAIARRYRDGGAAAISVLTEEDHFQGSLEDLSSVREAVDLPLLRKDFIFDTFQVYEAAAAGADAILLIAAMLSNAQISDLESFAEDEFGMDALIEVHSREELERFANSGAKLIGVNNRDLHTFNVSLDVSRELIKYVPTGSLMVAESGISTRSDISDLHYLGFAGFLIGETLMKSGDPEAELRSLNDQS